MIGQPGATASFITFEGVMAGSDRLTGVNFLLIVLMTGLTPLWSWLGLGIHRIIWGASDP